MKKKKNLIPENISFKKLSEFICQIGFYKKNKLLYIISLKHKYN